MNRLFIHSLVLLQTVFTLQFQITANAQEFSLESTVDGITIPNAHQLSENVFRGAQPGNKVNELIEQSFTDVIIFKTQTKNEVTDEIAALTNNHFKSEHVKWIPFPWKDIKEFIPACKQVVQAAQILIAVNKSRNRKVYFHCSVGEDRTGLLAGIFRMLVSNDWDAKRAFQEEMCVHGYSLGNPNKPQAVTRKIDKSLTPIFKTLAEAIEDSTITAKNLDPNICDDLEFDPRASRSYKCQ